MPENFSELEQKLSEKYPYGATEQEINEFCKEYKFLHCIKRKKHFLDKHVFRKD